MIGKNILISRMNEKYSSDDFDDRVTWTALNHTLVQLPNQITERDLMRRLLEESKYRLSQINQIISTFGTCKTSTNEQQMTTQNYQSEGLVEDEMILVEYALSELDHKSEGLVEDERILEYALSKLDRKIDETLKLLENRMVEQGLLPKDDDESDEICEKIAKKITAMPKETIQPPTSSASNDDLDLATLAIYHASWVAGVGEVVLNWHSHLPSLFSDSARGGAVRLPMIGDVPPYRTNDTPIANEDAKTPALM